MTDLNQFREETKQWLDENCPSTMRKDAKGIKPKHIDEVWGGEMLNIRIRNKNLLYKLGEKVGPCQQFHLSGGGGLSKEEQTLQEEMMAIGTNSPLLFGIWMLSCFT